MEKEVHRGQINDWFSWSRSLQEFAHAKYKAWLFSDSRNFWFESGEFRKFETFISGSFRGNCARASCTSKFDRRCEQGRISWRYRWSSNYGRKQLIKWYGDMKRENSLNLVNWKLVNDVVVILANFNRDKNNIKAKNLWRCKNIFSSSNSFSQQEERTGDHQSIGTITTRKQSKHQEHFVPNQLWT